MLVGGVVALLLYEALHTRYSGKETRWTELEQGYRQFLEKLDTLPLPRLNLKNSAVRLVDNILLIATMYLSLLVIGLQYAPVSPGRPTLPAGLPSTDSVYLLLYTILWGFWIVITQQRWALLIILLLSALLGLFNQVFIAIALFLASSYLSWKRHHLQLSFLVVLLASISTGIILRYSFTMNQKYGWIAWSPWLSSTIISISVGLASLVAYIVTTTQTDKLPSTPRRSSSSSISTTHTTSTRRTVKLYLLSTLVPLLLAALSILVPHIVHGFNKIISLDTVFNIKWLSLLHQKNYDVLFSSQRPLYILVVHSPILLLKVDPIIYFDTIVPLIGLSLLALSVFYMYNDTIHDSTFPWKTIAATLAITYWAPYFVYAGLQTNLLILPLALYFVKLIYRSLESNKIPLVKLISISTIIGLWHPWTLAYITVSIILLLFKVQSAESLNKLEKHPKLKLLLYSLVPGWISHTVIALIAKSSGVINVAYSLVASETPLLWSIKIFMWGTGMRPEYYLLSSITLLLYLLYPRRLNVEDSPKLTPWITTLTLPAFLGLLLPQTKHLLRLYINAPFPLLLVDILRTSKNRRITILLAILVPILTWIYFIFFAISPERVAPIKE